MPHRIPKQPTEIVRKWKIKLQRMARARHIQIRSETHILKLAGFISLFGEPGVEEAYQMQNALAALFFSRRRTSSRWGKAIKTLPADKDALRRIKDCVQAYAHIVEKEGGVAMAKANFRLDKVIEIMREVPDAEAFVKFCYRQDRRHPGSIFHKNMLEWAKRKLRGVWSYDEDGTHAQQVREAVDVIE